MVGLSKYNKNRLVYEVGRLRPGSLYSCAQLCQILILQLQTSAHLGRKGTKTNRHYLDCPHDNPFSTIVIRLILHNLIQPLLFFG